MNTVASTFDSAAADYAAQLNQGISLSGESAEYFVRGRAAVLAKYLSANVSNASPLAMSHLAAFVAAQAAERQVDFHRPAVMDFGCGIGNACGELHSQLNATRLMGYDCSPESITVAQRRYAETSFAFTADARQVEEETFDVIYSSGVFHHIEPEKRQQELNRVYGWLKPGGVFALFENNPWNPGTRWVMSRIPFDRDAKCLSIFETRRRLQESGFELVGMQSLFYFPAALRWLRSVESVLSLLPLGAQYVVLARRP